jgi:hypothetical protein
MRRESNKNKKQKTLEWSRRCSRKRRIHSYNSRRKSEHRTR